MAKRKSLRPGKTSFVNNRLTRENKRLVSKTGAPPGSMVHVGEQVTERVRITTLRYDQKGVQVTEDAGVGNLRLPVDRTSTLWVAVEGLHEVDTIESVCSHFKLHPLVTEDILNTTQRPKIEDLGDYIFVVLKILDQDKDASGFGAEQLSMVLGPNYLLTFLEGRQKRFEDVRSRLLSGRGRIRTGGGDYLLYCVIDSVVDRYFNVLERLADRIEVLEEDVINNPTTETIQAIHALKTDMIFVRRSVWPAREVASRLLSGQSTLIKDSSIPYLRDVYDHAVRVIDIMETYRDVVSGMLDIYLSSVSNRLNQVMKVLTIIATIFIPLTFLTGWYGMNFKNMPELDWRWGYPTVILVAVTTVVCMLAAFRRKDWI